VQVECRVSWDTSLVEGLHLHVVRDTANRTPGNRDETWSARSGFADVTNRRRICTFAHVGLSEQDVVRSRSQLCSDYVGTAAVSDDVA
jgi:hypothetical protein